MTQDTEAKTILLVEDDPLLWNGSIHPDDRPFVEEILAGPREQSGKSVEYRIQAKDGSWRTFRDRIISKTFDGDETIVDGFATDVTEQKRAEDQIRRLANENEMLVQEIRHRIKNIINAMTSLRSLQMQIEDYHYAHTVDDSGYHLET